MPPPSSSRSGSSRSSTSSSSSKSSSSRTSGTSSSSSSSRSKPKSSSSSSSSGSSRSSSHRTSGSSKRDAHLTIDISSPASASSPSSNSERDPNAKSLRINCTTNTWKRIMILLMFLCGGLMYVLFHTRLGETFAASLRDRGSHGWMQTQLLLHKDQSASTTITATTTSPTSQPSATTPNTTPQVDIISAITTDTPTIGSSSKSLLDSGSASKLQRLYEKLREKDAAKPKQPDASDPTATITILPAVPSDAPEVPEGLPYELPSSSFSPEKIKEAYQAMDGAATRYAGAPVVVQGVTLDTSDRDAAFKRDVIDVPKPPNYGKWNKLIYTPHPDPEVNQLLIESQKPTKSLIPKIVHFVFGLKDPRDVRYTLSEYLVMKAARDVIQAEKIYVHYVYEPGSSSSSPAPVPADGSTTTTATNDTPVYTAGASSFWWEKFVSETSKDVLVLNKLNPDKIGKVFGWTIKSYAHKADIVRLEALMTYGGIYLDMDMLVVRPLDHLLRFEMVMGEETTSDDANSTPHGLCNAFIMARRESFFLREWMKLHRMYEDERWAWHSVRLPLKLAGLYPNTIKTLPANQLFKPYMDENGQRQLYLSEDFNIDNNLGVHLWSGGAKYRTETDLNALCALKTTYGKLARMVLEAGAQPQFKYSCKKITPTVVPTKIVDAEDEKARNARTQF